MTRDSGQKPNLYDYWAHPDRAEQTRRSVGWMREYTAPFVMSLLPLAEIFAHQETVSHGYVSLSPPVNFEQFGFERPDLAVFAVLNDQVQTITQGEKYLGGVSAYGEMYEPYGLQGASTMIAAGDVGDERPPGEYAPYAMAMPAANQVASNFWVVWLPRL